VVEEEAIVVEVEEEEVLDDDETRPLPAAWAQELAEGFGEEDKTLLSCC